MLRRGRAAERGMGEEGRARMWVVRKRRERLMMVVRVDRSMVAEVGLGWRGSASML